ncbi:hypothetical protein GGQ84_001015 [Desulfitispora alkaliphila]|uniref:hypothetical protein n=1 Tax=Desulfitispora alkaliphila TaxID=622674 RepID=UPI003D1BD2BF
MKQLINSYISSQKKKRIKIKDIEKHVEAKVGLDKYWDKHGGYPSFAEAMVQEGALKPVKTWGLNGMQPSLHQGYQVLLQEDKLDVPLIQTLFAQFHPVGLNIETLPLISEDDRGLKLPTTFQGVVRRTVCVFDTWLKNSQKRVIYR